MSTTHTTTDLALLEQLLPDISAVSPSVALRQPLADLVEATLRAAGRSAHSRRAYQTAVGNFLAYLSQFVPAALADWCPLAGTTQSEHVDKRGRTYHKTCWEYRGLAVVLRLVSPTVLDGFRAYLEQEGASTNTATTRIYAVRTFLSVALRDGVLSQEQGKALDLTPYKQRQRRDTQPVGRRLTVAEVRKLRQAVDVDRVKGKRDMAIIDLMLYAGLRADEAASLSGSDMRQDGGRWWIVFEGKGSKTRRVKVHDVLYQSISAWAAISGQQPGTGACLFVGVNKGDNITGECINAGVVGRLVAEYAEHAGLGQLSPHDLRRTFARNAYDNGASLLVIQAQLGHKDPKTTAQYIGAFESDDNTAVDFVRY